MAESVSDLADKTITVYRGTGIFGIYKHLQHCQTDIRTSNDPVSILSRGQTGGKKIAIKILVLLIQFMRINIHI